MTTSCFDKIILHKYFDSNLKNTFYMWLKNLNKKLNWHKIAIRTVLFVVAILIAFASITYINPTIAHAQAPTTQTQTTQRPATTTTTNTKAAPAKPLDACVVIGGCLGNIDKYKSTSTTGQGGIDGLIRFILDIVSVMIYISYAIAVLFLIISGYKMISAQGNEKEYGDAQKMFMYTVYGLIAVVCSQTVVALIGVILNNFKF